MPEGSPLRQAVKQLILDTLQEYSIVQQQNDNEQGTVASVNDDGSVNVATQSGLYQNVGTPVQRVVGESVVVVTADGVRVAI